MFKAFAQQLAFPSTCALALLLPSAAMADDNAVDSETGAPETGVAEGEATSVTREATGKPTKSRIPLRKGGVFSIGHGIQSCHQQYCKLSWDGEEQPMRIGQSFFLEGGARPIPWIDITGGFTFATSRKDHSDELDAAILSLFAWYSLHTMVRAYPLNRTVFDPFVGLGFGYTQFAGWTRVFDDSPQPAHHVDLFTRANLLMTVGLDVFLHRRIVLSGFFRYNIGMGGRMCVWPDSTQSECISMSELREFEEFRGMFPNPWEVALAIKFRGLGKGK